MKLLVWNINSLVPTVRNAVLKYGSWTGFFQEHGVDIVCLQESKVLDDKLTKELVCPEGFQSFWAISRDKKGYSGVTTYAADAYAPTGCEADCLGEQEGEDLDREGRVVITDHGHFVLVNVYVPNAGERPDRPRLAYKLCFLEALKRKCDELAAAGREVLLVGDFNVPAEPRDMHPALGPFSDQYAEEEVAALRALTESYTDVWRRLHPEEGSTYTVWHEKTSARAFNHGLRIDYVLCTPGLLRHVVSCEVLSAEVLPPKWSDHAGIQVEFRDLPPLSPHPPCPHWQRLNRRFNPPNQIANLFAAGRKRSAEAGKSGGAGGGAAGTGAAAPAAQGSKGSKSTAAAAAQASQGTKDSKSTAAAAAAGGDDLGAAAQSPGGSRQQEAAGAEGAEGDGGEQQRQKRGRLSGPAAAAAGSCKAGSLQQGTEQAGRAAQVNKDTGVATEAVQHAQLRKGAGSKQKHATQQQQQQQQQQPDAGQRTIGSFFTRK